MMVKLINHHVKHNFGLNSKKQPPATHRAAFGPATRTCRPARVARTCLGMARPHPALAADMSMAQIVTGTGYFNDNRKLTLCDNRIMTTPELRGWSRMMAGPSWCPPQWQGPEGGTSARPSPCVDPWMNEGVHGPTYRGVSP